MELFVLLFEFVALVGGRWNQMGLFYAWLPYCPTLVNHQLATDAYTNFQAKWHSPTSYPVNLPIPLVLTRQYKRFVFFLNKGLVGWYGDERTLLDEVAPRMSLDHYPPAIPF